MLKLIRALTSFLYIIVLYQVYSHETLAIEDSSKTCINGHFEHNLALKKSFDDSWDPLRISYFQLKPKDLTKEPQTELMCTEGVKSISSFQIDLPQMAIQLQSHVDNTKEKFKLPQLISRECIEAALKRHPGNLGYICEPPENTPKTYGRAGGKTAQCIDHSMTDYIHFAFNSAIQCLADTTEIDSKAIFRKINNESAFNPSVASRGGVGFGQLTSSAVAEMTNPRLGNGRYILEKVANSNRQICSGFKDVAIKDLADKNLQYSLLRPKDKCKWLSPGDGLARNLLYSIGYFITLKEKYIEPKLKKKLPLLANNPELINELTTIAYSAEGINHARSLIDTIRNKDLTVSDVLKKIRDKSNYLRQTQSKMKEMLCFKKNIHPSSKECNNTEFTKSEMEGEPCVSNQL